MPTPTPTPAPTPAPDTITLSQLALRGTTLIDCRAPGRRCGGGLGVRYRLNRAGTVTFKLTQHVCSAGNLRERLRGSLILRSRAGAHSYTLHRRMGRLTLPYGRYRVGVIARAGAASAPEQELELVVLAHPRARPPARC